MAPRTAWIRVATSLLVVLASLLAGCASPTGTSAVEPVSAEQAAEMAEANATRWQPDAELVLLSGVEAPEGAKSTREVPDEEGRSQPAAPVDPSVGDGRAPRWTALFYSQSANATRSYQVTSGAAEDQGPAASPSERPTPLRNWTLDSTQAVGTALENASFRTAALASDGEVIQTLGMRGQIPAWQLVARSPSNGQHVQILVNAANGEILEPEDRAS